MATTTDTRIPEGFATCAGFAKIWTTHLQGLGLLELDRSIPSQIITSASRRDGFPCGVDASGRKIIDVAAAITFLTERARTGSRVGGGASDAGVPVATAANRAQRRRQQPTPRAPRPEPSVPVRVVMDPAGGYAEVGTQADWEARVAQLEADGLDTSDAQAAADAEMLAASRPLPAALVERLDALQASGVITWERYPSGSLQVMTKGRDEGIGTPDLDAVSSWLDKIEAKARRRAGQAAWAKAKRDAAKAAKVAAGS